MHISPPAGEALPKAQMLHLPNGKSPKPEKKRTRTQLAHTSNTELGGAVEVRPRRRDIPAAVTVIHEVALAVGRG
eukprot:5495678-Pyramimonas_sp.AAC.1